METNHGRTRLHLKRMFALVTLAILFWAVAAASAQSMPSQDNDGRDAQFASVDRFLDSHPEISEQLAKDPSLIRNKEFVQKHPELQEFLQSHPEVREEFAENPNAFMRQEQRFERHEEGGNMRFGDRDTTRGELASMDRFLDSHPAISEQLARDPSLIRNKEFVQKHPELQEFLQSHPEVRQEFTENPDAFMRQERRFERHEEVGNGRFDDRDTTRAELAGMDRFLDNHPEIGEQLAKDPSLVRNKEFVASHPELQQFLQSHPEVREEFAENPNAFMRQERRFERHEEAGSRLAELSGMDRFLDNHQEIAEQLGKDPSLIRNQQFVANHPELQQFLQSHPEVRQEFSENPNAFMRQEQRFDQHEDLRSQSVLNHGMGHGERVSFGQFLSSHSGLGQQLSKDPSLVNNKEWLESHPELGEFLKSHPAVKQQLAENPGAFMSTVQTGNNTAESKTVLQPKHKQ